MCTMTSKNILIIDDDENDIALFSAWLDSGDSYQFNLFSANSANAGLNIVQKEHIDCVIVDYKMAGATGLDFLKSIGKLQKEFPVILSTAFHSEEVEINSIEEGAQFFIKKSDLNKTELRQRVIEAIELQQHNLLESYHAIQKMLVKIKYEAA